MLNFFSLPYYEIKPLHIFTSQSSSARYIKESYYATDGSTWYRLYSDGWCEQGGTVCASGSYTMAIVNFPKKFVLGYIPFATAKYIHAPEHECAQTGYTTVRFDFHTSAFITSLTNEQMKFGNGGQNDGGLVAYVWYACGVTA